VGNAVVGLDDGLAVGDEVGTFVGLTVVGSSVSIELLVATTDEFVCPTLGERIVVLFLLSDFVIIGVIAGDASLVNGDKAVGALLPTDSAPVFSS